MAVGFEVRYAAKYRAKSLSIGWRHPGNAGELPGH
jgi:hypothetical protein